MAQEKVQQGVLPVKSGTGRQGCGFNRGLIVPHDERYK